MGDADPLELTVEEIDLEELIWRLRLVAPAAFAAIPATLFVLVSVL
jgi:hypothetical protein